VQGEILAPAEIEQKLSKRFRLLGTQGLVGMALAAIDMAVWDALARIHQMPLVQLLGGLEKPIRAYGAVGYDGVTGSAKVLRVGPSSDSQESKQRSGTPRYKRMWPLCGQFVRQRATTWQ
jgi:mandelate racemase